MKRVNQFYVYSIEIKMYSDFLSKNFNGHIFYEYEILKNTDRHCSQFNSRNKNPSQNRIPLKKKKIIDIIHLVNAIFQSIIINFSFKYY